MVRQQSGGTPDGVHGSVCGAVPDLEDPGRTDDVLPAAAAFRSAGDRMSVIFQDEVSDDRAMVGSLSVANPAAPDMNLGTGHDMVQAHPGKVQPGNPVLKQKVTIGVTVTPSPCAEGVPEPGILEDGANAGRLRRIEITAEDDRAGFRCQEPPQFLRLLEADRCVSLKLLNGIQWMPLAIQIGPERVETIPG
jgi:hypothetical protein